MRNLFALFLPVASWLLPLAWLWFSLINQLRVEWTVNPQYAYGWAVPFLCGYLIWQRSHAGIWRMEIEVGGRLSRSNFHFQPSFFYSLLGLIALLYAPTRLIQEANPEWRLVSWALAIEVIGLTLLTAYALAVGPREMGDGSRPIPTSNFLLATMQSRSFQLRNILFPICFFLVAVPWPTALESRVIQTLTRANAATTIEIANMFGIPALQRGNVIELSTGWVGIDEACSGIRSFQAALMIALFLGDLYRLNALRRALLALSGFALSFVFNVSRTVMLVSVAAKQGIDAISRWHDPAGVTILVSCFLGLWGIGVAMGRAERRERRAESGELKPELGGQPPAINPPVPDLGRQPAVFRLASLLLLIWLVATEAGTEIWYRAHERGLSTPVRWTVQWPQDFGGFKEVAIAERSRQLLRYDAGRSGQWLDGVYLWQAIYLRWNAGHIAAHLARSHTPEVCLTAAGHDLETLPGLKTVTVQGLTLPFRAYSFHTGPAQVFVFYCLWEDRQRERTFDTESLTVERRLAAVRDGRRNLGQRSLEVAVSGMPDAAAAEVALVAQLERLIVVEPGTSGQVDSKTAPDGQ